jgi:WD40 repeat protein
MLLIAPGNSQARLFSRDADDLGIFCKGDPYLKDLRVTKGHTSNLTTCQWHPIDREKFLTAAFDSTIRIWDVEERETQRHVIAVKSKWKGGRTPISSARFSRDARLVVGSGQDGCIRIWDIKSSFSVPRFKLEKAHQDGMHITSSFFSMDGNQLLTRCMDQTIKLWDMRKFKAPVNSVTDIPTFYEESNAIFSPNERYIVAGTSSNSKGGSIRVFDRKTLEPVTSIATEAGVLKVNWTPKLNQIFAGCSDGSVQVFYDPERSRGGILLPLSKGPKKLAADDYDVAL